MAFVKTLASMFPTLGSPNFAGPPATTLAGGGTSATPQAIAIVTAGGGGSQTVTFTPISGPGTFTRGWVRVKTTSINAATTSVTASIRGSDGTTTQFFAAVPNALPGAAANQSVDYMIPFMSDLNLTSLIVVVTSATNTATFDVEAALNT